QREVIDAYLRFHNANVERWRSKRGRLAWEDEQRVGSYRSWQVETWSLAGPPESWGEQLVRHQRGRPGFALLAGLAPRPAGGLGAPRVGGRAADPRLRRVRGGAVPLPRDRPAAAGGGPVQLLLVTRPRARSRCAGP